MNTLHNLGHHERVIRVGIGVVLLALSGFSLFPGWGDLLLMLVGLIALLTGIIGYCPAWQAVGLNTCHVKSDQTINHQPEEHHEHSNASTHQS